MTTAPDISPFIFIIAGEPSGDAIGAALIAALRERTGGRLKVDGIGGERMRAEGLTSLVPLSDLAIAGIAEVLPRAPHGLPRRHRIWLATRARQWVPRASRGRPR